MKERKKIVIIQEIIKSFHQHSMIADYWAKYIPIHLITKNDKDQNRDEMS